MFSRFLLPFAGDSLSAAVTASAAHCTEFGLRLTVIERHLKPSELIVARPGAVLARVTTLYRSRPTRTPVDSEHRSMLGV